MKAFNKFSTAFQTHASCIGTLDSDVGKLFRAYMSNFIGPVVLKSADDITGVSYQDRSKQMMSLVLELLPDY